MESVNAQHAKSIQAADQAMSGLTGQIDEIQQESARRQKSIDEVQRKQRETSSRHKRRMDDIRREQRHTASKHKRRIDEVQREQRETVMRLDNVECKKTFLLPPWNAL